MNIYLFEFIFLFLICLWVKTVSIILIILLNRFIFSNSKMKMKSNKNYISTIALLNNKFINCVKEMVEHLFIIKKLIDCKIYKYLISR